MTDIPADKGYSRERAKHLVTYGRGHGDGVLAEKYERAIREALAEGCRLAAEAVATGSWSGSVLDGVERIRRLSREILSGRLH